MSRRLLLAFSLLAAAACSPSIPEEYADLVPEEGRDALTKVIPPNKDPSPLNAPQLMVWYDAEKTTAETLGKAYAKKFSDQGYEALTDCEQEKDSVDHLFAKIDGDKRITVQFNAYVLTETTIDGRLIHSDEITTLTLSEHRTCKWTPFAEEFCAGGAKDKHCFVKKL